MEFLIKFDTVKSGSSMVYIEGSQAIISKRIFYIDFVLANNADYDEILRYVAFHLGLHYLSKYPLG